MELNEEGQIVSHRIVESAICVARRMSYTQVSQILSALKLLESERSPEQKALLAEHQEFLGDFAAMEELARKRIQIRDDRGAIDFDFPECKITTMVRETSGNQPYERNIATRIIEEFMLLANETVAQEYYWRDVPFVYRTHEKPDPEKIRTLNTFVYNMGHRIKGSKGGERSPQGPASTPGGIGGKTRRRDPGQADTPVDEASQIHRQHGDRPFRFGRPILLPLHIAHPALSGSDDPPDHQAHPAPRV